MQQQVTHPSSDESDFGSDDEDMQSARMAHKEREADEKRAVVVERERHRKQFEDWEEEQRRLRAAEAAANAASAAVGAPARTAMFAVKAADAVPRVSAS
jgi:hypothetical protein